MADPVTHRPVATVAECWRYPVKSLQGATTTTLDLSVGGVVGDRERGLIDDAGHVLSAKRTSALLDARADDQALTLPDGTTLAYDEDRAATDAALSTWLGRPVRLVGEAEAGDRSYEMTFDPPNDDADYFEIPTPAGSLRDLAPIHLLCASTLAHCARQRPDLDWNPRRFRPNLVLDTELAGFAEHEWIGRDLQIGGAVLHIDGPTVRCAMPLRAQPGGLARQPELFRAMNELNETFPNHLGLYASVVTPGPVATGDTVHLS